jgi:hypothetical protein
MASATEQSPQTKAITAWAQGFIDSDIDQIAAALHPDYVHETFPRSLKIPQQTKEQWVENYRKIKDVLKNFKVCTSMCAGRLLGTFLIVLLG